jgi:alcohol dehydrogenase class IV
MSQSIVAPRQILIGGGSLSRLGELLKQFGLSRPLVEIGRASCRERVFQPV